MEEKGFLQEMKKGTEKRKLRWEIGVPDVLTGEIQAVTKNGKPLEFASEHYASFAAKKIKAEGKTVYLLSPHAGELPRRYF